MNRKSKQAEREKWEESRVRIEEGTRSLMLVIDGIFNKGKDAENIMPPTYEEALKRLTSNTNSESQFVSEQWWKKSE